VRCRNPSTGDYIPEEGEIALWSLTLHPEMTLSRLTSTIYTQNGFGQLRAAMISQQIYQMEPQLSFTLFQQISELNSTGQSHQIFPHHPFSEYLGDLQKREIVPLLKVVRSTRVKC
jgi:hypothetical protein